MAQAGRDTPCAPPLLQYTTGDSGVRPSPGAATSANHACLETVGASCPAGIAAAGDGRAPRIDYDHDDEKEKDDDTAGLGGIFILVLVLVLILKTRGEEDDEDENEQDDGSPRWRRQGATLRARRLSCNTHPAGRATRSTQKLCKLHNPAKTRKNGVGG